MAPVSSSPSSSCCARCAKAIEGGGGVPCKSCYSSFYCTKVCQSAHFSYHQHQCLELANVMLKQVFDQIGGLDQLEDCQDWEMIQMIANITGTALKGADGRDGVTRELHFRSLLRYLTVPGIPADPQNSSIWMREMIQQAFTDVPWPETEGDMLYQLTCMNEMGNLGMDIAPDMLAIIRKHGTRIEDSGMHFSVIADFLCVNDQQDGVVLLFGRRPLRFRKGSG